MSPLQILRDLSITRKLSLSFLVLTLMVLLVGWVAVDRLAAINGSTVEMRNNWLIGIQKLGQADSLIADERRLATTHLLSENAMDKVQIDNQIKAGRMQFDATWGSYLSTVRSAEEKVLIADFRQKYELYLREIDAVMDHSRAYREVEARALLLSKAGPTQDTVRSAMHGLVAYNQRGAIHTVVKAAELFESGWKFIAILVLVFVLVSAALVWLMQQLLLQPILRLTRALEALAGGRSDVIIAERDRSDEIGRMAQGLLAFQSTVLAHEETAWVKNHATQIVTALQGLDNLTEFARQLMLELTPAVGAQVGAYYSYDKSTQRLTHLGSYGYKHRKGLVQHFAVGEGIVGQCALERSPITLSNVPQDYVLVASGLGATTPQFVLAVPVMASDRRILAVVELASLVKLNPKQQALIDEVLPLISLNIEILERNQHTRELLAQSLHPASADPTLAQPALRD